MGNEREYKNLDQFNKLQKEETQKNDDTIKSTYISSTTINVNRLNLELK